MSFSFVLRRAHWLILSVAWVVWFASRPVMATPVTQTSSPQTLHDAVTRYVQQRPVKAGNTWDIAGLYDNDEVGYAFVVVKQTATNQMVSYAPDVVVAQRVNGEWRVTGKEQPAQFNAWLSAIPETLLTSSMKSVLRVSESAPLRVANFTGYKLPWSKDGQACVVQVDTSGGNCGDGSTGHGYAGVDFHIEDGQTTGEVLAAKDGTVVFRKDTSNYGCPTCDWTYGNLVVLQHSPMEYSWYLHLAQYSIPYAIQVNTFVPRGTVLGTQGSTGYSTGTHLHFHVATTYSCCQNSGDPVRIMPWWPGDGNIYPVDFDEVSWDTLRASTYVVSQNTRADCNTVNPNSYQIAIFNFKNYCGTARVLNQGDYADDFAMSFADNSASSVKVGANMKATLCKNMNFQGGCEDFMNNDSDLSDNLIGDNQTSSVRVQLRVAPPMTPTLINPPSNALLREGQPVTLTWVVTAEQSMAELTGGPLGTVNFGWQASLTQSLSGLPAGYAYTWRVKARNSAGESPWSPLQTFSVKPAAPSSLSGNATTCRTIVLSWLNNSAATVLYNVYRNGSVVSQVANTNFSDGSLTSNATYTYVITAIRNNLESDASNPINIKTPSCPTPLAYIYNTDTTLRDSFVTLLVSHNFTVSLVSQSSALTYDFIGQQAVIVGDDTTWLTSANVGNITLTNRLIIGLGQGGAQFFAAAGLPLAAPLTQTVMATSVLAMNLTNPIWTVPNAITLSANNDVALYTTPTPMLSSSATLSQTALIPLGQQLNDAIHAPLIAQRVPPRCFMLWGFRGAATTLTPTGQNLFVNVVSTWPCATYRVVLPLIAR